MRGPLPCDINRFFLMFEFHQYLIKFTIAVGFCEELIATVTWSMKSFQSKLKTEDQVTTKTSVWHLWHNFCCSKILNQHKSISDSVNLLTVKNPTFNQYNIILDSIDFNSCHIPSKGMLLASPIPDQNWAWTDFSYSCQHRIKVRKWFALAKSKYWKVLKVIQTHN